MDAGLPSLPNIMPKQARQQKAGRHRFAFGHAAIGVFERGLHKRVFDALHGQRQQRIDAVLQAQFLQLRNTGQCVACLQQLEHFIKHAALRHIVQQGQALLQRRSGVSLQLEAQPRQLGRDAHGAHEPHRIFAVALRRIPDHAENALLRIGHALVVVHHDLAFGVVIHGIDGEVAPRSVFFLPAPHVVAQHAPRCIHRMLHACQRMSTGFFVAADLLGRGGIEIGAEGGDLDYLVLAATAKYHVHDAKAPPDDEGAPKQTLDLFRRGIGGHIKVFGFEARQQITHGSTHDIGLEPGFFESAHHFGCALIHQLGINMVNGCRNLDAFAEGVLARGRIVFAEELVDKALDHDCQRVGKRSRIRHPRSCATARKLAEGLVATGCCARSSKGRSLGESE